MCEIHSKIPVFKLHKAPPSEVIKQAKNEMPLPPSYGLVHSCGLSLAMTD